MAQFSYFEGGAGLFQIPPINGRHFHIWRFGMDDEVWNVMLSEMKLGSGGVYTPDVDGSLNLFDVRPNKNKDMRKVITQEVMDNCTAWIKARVGDAQSGSKFPAAEKSRVQLDWIFKNAVSFDPKTLKLTVTY